MGAGKWLKQCKEHNIHTPLKNRTIWIFPDNDDDGENHARDVAESLSGFARTVKIVKLPDLPPKGDIYDFVQIHGPEKAKRLILELGQAAPEYEPDPNYNPEVVKKKASKRGEELSKFQKLLNLFYGAHGSVFLDQHKTGWSTLDRKTHHENVRLSSRAFARHLIQLHAHEYKDGVSRELTTQISDYLTEQATEERYLWNRFAWRDGTLFIDMGTPQWETIEVTPQGWKITRPSIPPFRRYSHQQALPMPDPQGGVDALASFLDLLPIKGKDPENKHLPLKDLLVRYPDTLVPQILLITWIILAPLAHIPRPSLIVHGEPGAGKSGVTRFLRDLTDPSSTPLLSLSKDHAEFVQLIDHHAILTLDNLNGLPPWAVEDLCTAVTGGGFSKRALYSDDDDFTSSYKRTFVLNGINIPSLAPDLLDRSILIALEWLPNERRRDEEALRREFEKLRPRILGAILNVLSKAMGIVQSIHMDSHPRMADWTKWGCAVADVTGIGRENFLKAYSLNRENRNEEIVTSDPVCNAIVTLIEQQGRWQGTPAELYEELSGIAKEQKVSVSSKHQWPQNPQALTRKLNVVNRNLRVNGIVIERGRENKRRDITIKQGDPIGA
jgi:hypothetical protein